MLVLLRRPAGLSGGGPLALRASQDALSVRVLVDAIVVEAFWDGGRACSTGRVTGRPGNDGVLVSAGDVTTGVITADIAVWEMGSTWLLRA